MRGASHELADIRILVPLILASHGDSLPHAAGGVVVERAELTSTGVAVVILAPYGDAPSLVIKMPVRDQAAHGLARESRALTALHADGRLDGWRRLIPQPCGSGRVMGRPYRIEVALRGSPAIDLVRQRRTRGRVLEATAAAIDALHRATETKLAGGVDVARRWVDLPIEELLRRSHRRASMRLPLERLRRELHDALGTGSFSVGWIHGDYWPGNLLVSGQRLQPAGIVDWEAAQPDGLPLNDLLHLLLYTRRLVSGEQLGWIVRRQLSANAWSAHERRLLDRYATWRRDGCLSDRHALLLYWLRHAALHARQQPSQPGYRYRLWERRNVDPVVATL